MELLFLLNLLLLNITQKGQHEEIPGFYIRCIGGVAGKSTAAGSIKDFPGKVDDL
jgi:hypothetical protein